MRLEFKSQNHQKIKIYKGHISIQMMLDTSWGKCKLKSWLAMHILKWLKYLFSFLTALGIKPRPKASHLHSATTWVLKSFSKRAVLRCGGTHLQSQHLGGGESVPQPSAACTISHHNGQQVNRWLSNQTGIQAGSEMQVNEGGVWLPQQRELTGDKRHYFWVQGVSLRRLQTV
jgi:hypothetical protein